MGTGWLEISLGEVVAKLSSFGWRKSSYSNHSSWVIFIVSETTAGFGNYESNRWIIFYPIPMGHS